MKEDIIVELSKYSKEILIKAFVEHNLFGKDDFLRNVRSIEFDNIQLKQKGLAAEMKKLNPWNAHTKYVNLRNKYDKYDKQIKKLFTEKHYPIDFIDFILTELKGGKNMVKKKEYIEEDEEEFEEEEDEVPRPQYKNVKPKEVVKKEVPKDTFKQEVIEAIKNLNLRISGIESSLYRAGVLR